MRRCSYLGRGVIAIFILIGIRTCAAITHLGLSSAAIGSQQSGCAIKTGSRWRYQSLKPSGSGGHCVARAQYTDAALTISNFGRFSVQTNGTYADDQQMFAAGFLEGWLSAERIYDYFSNTQVYFTQTLQADLGKPLVWLQEQDQWARQQAFEGNTTYHAMLGLILAQFDGMIAGYQARHVDAKDNSTIPFLSKTDFLFVNGNGELYDVIPHFDPEAQNKMDTMNGKQLYAHLATLGHCSGLVKITRAADGAFNLESQDTYSSMVKLYKHYQFALHLPGIAAQRMSFSSYPGELFSDDDLYMMDSNITVLSTTNHIFNNSLFEGVVPQSLVSWQRVRVANALASTGKEWVEMLDCNQSGTYNNQYMVLDLKQFKPGKELRPGTLWVAEQIPGLIEAADMTNALVRGYWPSYNVPYFPEVYKRSGIEEFRQAQLQKARQAKDAAEAEGYLRAASWMSYQLAPRAIIFRRDSTHVSNISSLKHIMRYNHFREEELAKGDPYFAVCSRGDLDADGPLAKGCYDSKVTNHEMAQQLISQVVNGPTTNDGLPPFRWTSQFSDIPHRGQAQEFNFDFELQSPELLNQNVNHIA